MRKIDKVLEAYFSGLESPNSQRGYRQVWGAFTAWLDGDVLRAKPPDVQRYAVHLRDEGRAKTTRAWSLSVIRSVYDALVVGGLVATNPARSVKNPRTSQAPRAPWLEEDAVRALLGALSGEDWRERRNRLCVLLFLGLGWRRAEVARMKVEDFRDGTVTGIVKGGKAATVGVPDWLRREVAAWCKWAEIEDGPILPRSSTVAVAVSPDTVYNIVREAARRAGLEASPHALRRTFITVLRGRGADLKKLQLAVAHSSSVTTERYDRGRQISAPGEDLKDLVYK